jgi:hypothetical protein
MSTESYVKIENQGEFDQAVEAGRAWFIIDSWNANADVARLRVGVMYHFVLRGTARLVCESGSSQGVVFVQDDSSVSLRGEFLVELKDNATGSFRGRCSVTAKGMSRVFTYGRSHATPLDEVKLELLDFAFAYAEEAQKITAWRNSRVIARRCPDVKAYENASVYAWESKVAAYHASTVEAHGGTEVKAFGLSSVRVLSDQVEILQGPNFLGHIQSAAFKAPRDLTVYKKLWGNSIATLRIPKGTQMQSLSGYKFRAEKAVVLKIRDSAGKPVETGVSEYDRNFEYVVGRTVEPSGSPYNSSLTECSSGIHFFLSPEDAQSY